MKEFLKIIEHFIKELIKRFVFVKRMGNPILLTNFEKEIFNCKSILILRQDRIGDLLVSVPFIRNLRNSIPNADISILLSKRNSVAYSCIRNYINHYYILPRNIFFSLWLIFKLQKKFDLIIDPFDNPSVTSSLLVKTLKPKYSLGFIKENSSVYTHIVELPDKSKFHIVERLANLLIPFGLKPNEVNLYLEYPRFKNNLLPPKSNPRLGINISGSSPLKFWGRNNFLMLMNLILSKFEFEIIIFSTKKYKNELGSFEKIPNVQIAPFTNNFDEFASMIATCDYLITPDTSVVHLASAFKIPVLAFYQYIDPKFGMPWLPYGNKFVYLTSTKNNFIDISPEKMFKSFCNLVDGQ